MILERIRRRLIDMATCRDVGRLLQTYLDGELDDAERARVGAHLERCLRCGPEGDVYARIKSALARAAQDPQTQPGDRLAVERLRRFAATIITTGDRP
ncbi:MAG: anti-sigma factor family protein [Acidimicrobiales bacterium]